MAVPYHHYLHLPPSLRTRRRRTRDTSKRVPCLPPPPPFRHRAHEDEGHGTRQYASPDSLLLSLIPHHPLQAQGLPPGLETSRALGLFFFFLFFFHHHQ